MLSNDRSPTDPGYSDESPSYGFFSKEMATTIGVAAGMMLVTVALMLVLADTIVADVGLMLYGIFPLLGVGVFGGLISVGRYFGMKGLISDNTRLAIAGATVSILGYGWFGSAVLSPFQSSLYIPALLVTGGITIAITLAIAIVVFGTDYNFSWTAKASGACFLVGIVLILIVSFISIQILSLIAFGLFLLGFLFDLVYEIYLTATNARNPIANGLGVYIAFAGVFVHILQMVLRAMARE